MIHCSATREDRPFTEQDLETAHRLRGFDGIGYHFYVRRNGDIKVPTRVGTMQIQLEFVMRVDWIATGWRRIRGRNGRNIHYGYWYGL